MRGKLVTAVVDSRQALSVNFNGLHCCVSESWCHGHRDSCYW
jgi:hypothetical protein